MANILQIVITILALAACQTFGTATHELTWIEVGAPTIQSVTGSRCGSVSGGVRLTLHGGGWDHNTKVVVALFHRPKDVVKPEWVNCPIVERDDSKIVCVTGKAFGPTGTVGSMYVKFAEAQPQEVPGFRFIYVADPEIKPNQKLRGIRSGGTRVHVALARMRCVESVQMYVEESGHRRIGHGFCKVRPDETGMDCPVPELMMPDQKQYSCGFTMNYGGQPLEIPCSPPKSYYRTADPVFYEFVTFTNLDSHLVVFGINGEHLNDGFLVGDVDIKFGLTEGSPADVPCEVSELTEIFIACKPPAHVDVSHVRELDVKIGNVHSVVHNLI